MLRCVDEPKSKRLTVEFLQDFVVCILQLEQPPTKSLEQVTIGQTFFSDVHKFVRSCLQCQLFTGKQKMKALSLKPIVVQAPFQQWGLDFIGKFKDNSSNGYSWILTATDYFTKWVEAIPTKKATDAVVMDFLEDRIITRFGVTVKIITDNGPCFSSS